MKKNSFLRILFILVTLTLTHQLVLAADYYIDGAKGLDSNPGTLSSPWKTIAKANSTLKAGDTVFLRSGLYNYAINPVYQGTLNNPITYKRYPQDEEWSVELQTKSYGVYIDNKDHIKIDGLFFSYSGSRWVELVQGSDYFIAENCKFYNSLSYRGVNIPTGCSYTKIINCTFPDAPALPAWLSTEWDTGACGSPPYGNDPSCNSDSAPADMVQDRGTGTLIQGCFFGNSTHQSIAAIGKDCVYRNNTMANTYHTGIGYDGVRALIENNRVLDSGYRKLDSPLLLNRINKNGGGIYIMAENSIVRQNISVNNDYGIYFGAKAENARANNVRIYQNTIFNNWFQIFLTTNNSYNYNDSILKNNLIYDIDIDMNRAFIDKTGKFPGPYILANHSDAPFKPVNYFVNNAWTPNSDTFYFKNTIKWNKCLEPGGSGNCTNGYLEKLNPIEWDPSNFYGDPYFEDTANYNLNLTSSSTAMIDTGAWLTTITSNSGAGKSFVVDDSLYFYDGWNIPGEVGDTIYTSANQSAMITSIDYTNHTVTVNSPVSWTQGDGITTVKYNGSAPDIGAFEYGGDTPPDSGLEDPTGLKVGNEAN